jgi:hypothetical protein
MTQTASATCRACGQSVDTSKPEGWGGEHRYGCNGPATWIGFLEGWSHYHSCHCGERATFRIRRGLNNLYACSAEHGRSRKSSQTSARSPFASFVTACYPTLPKSLR